MSVDTLLSRLDGVQGKGPRYRAICPAHESKHKSRTLSVYEADDGRVLLHCHAGCDVGDIALALGIELSDLFPEPVGTPLRNPRIRKPWSTRQVAEALEAETMVAWVLLSDMGNGKVMTRGDRERAKLAAERCAHLLQELAHAG